MIFATLTAAQAREIIDISILAGGLVWLVLCVAVAAYGNGKGYPFFPLFISGVFLGPIGWPLVLLAVTIAAGRAEKTSAPATYFRPAEAEIINGGSR